MLFYLVHAYLILLPFKMNPPVWVIVSVLHGYETESRKHTHSVLSYINTKLIWASFYFSRMVISLVCVCVCVFPTFCLIALVLLWTMSPGGAPSRGRPFFRFHKAYSEFQFKLQLSSLTLLMHCTCFALNTCSCGWNWQWPWPWNMFSVNTCYTSECRRWRWDSATKRETLCLGLFLHNTKQASSAQTCFFSFSFFSLPESWKYQTHWQIKPAPLTLTSHFFPPAVSVTTDLLKDSLRWCSVLHHLLGLMGLALSSTCFISPQKKRRCWATDGSPLRQERPAGGTALLWLMRARTHTHTYTHTHTHTKALSTYK